MRDRKANRYALERYVDDKDEWYWSRTKALAKSNWKKTVAMMVITAAVSMGIIIFSQFRK